jgi:DNA mismatch repair protein MutL
VIISSVASSPYHLSLHGSSSSGHNHHRLMVIHALPENAIRSLGSGQVLTDSVALIKELIENSLDAGATQITIEVSPNLLDNIQVKDNGFGIASVDRDSVCLRHCTSKLHNFEDVHRVRTLGFRGEALASAAELSERMVFTTRVEGEPVAQVCEVGRDGKMKEKRTVGAPVGTTVRVEGFLKKLPVRRENAIRQEKKLLAKLKVLVAKYYISRPSCRFGLKVVAKGRVGGKGDDVVHAPSKSIPEAVKKVVGNQAAGACEWVAKTEGGITIEAFLPKKDGDPAVFSGRPDCTHYVYVDSRPVSCARGILKSLRSLYKGYLNSTASEKAGRLSDPLLYLNIRCPTGSYDPNVEPAKDDVMFDKNSGEAIVNIAEELFKGLYGELNETVRNRVAPKEKQQKEKHADRGFEVLLARKKDVVESPPTVRPEAPDLLMEAVLAEAEEEGMLRPLNEVEIGIAPGNSGCNRS